MKAMKRWMGTLLALVMVIGICPVGRAANDPYLFEEWDMEVTVPEGDYYILTRDMDPDDPTLADVGLTAEYVNEIFSGGSFYLDALYYDSSYELIVAVMEGEEYERLFNYDLLSKKQKEYTLSLLKEEMKKQGTPVVGDVVWYEGGEASFMVGEFGPSGANNWTYQYQTIYNGRMITVYATSVISSEPTDEIKEQTRLLAEGVHFTRKLPVPQAVKEAYEEKEPSILMAGLKGALRGAVIGVAVYVILGWFRKRKKKETEDPCVKNEPDTGGDEP